MAIMSEGILGGFRGKIGTVVGVSSGDKFYMRSLPRKRKKAGPKELSNRAKFKLVLDHLEPIKDLVKAGFKDHYTKTGGYRAAFSYNRKYAVAGDGTGFYISPESFRFSGGDLPGAVDPGIIIADEMLEITWAYSSDAGGSHSDQLMILLYDPANSGTVTKIFDGPFRAAGNFSMPVPETMKGREADLYIAFVAADRSAQSNSQYLGRVEL